MDNDKTPDSMASQIDASTEENMTSVDRWDRRFRIRGDAIEALQVVVADISSENS